MKKLSILLMALFLTIGYGFAQETFIGSYFEVTNISPKAGVQVGRKIEYDLPVSNGHSVISIELGGFYQKESNSIVESASETKTRKKFKEEEFMGVFFSTRLVGFYNGAILFNVRTGVTNRENFAITPSLITSYKIMKHVEINLGLGVRSTKPTVQGGLRLSL